MTVTYLDMFAWLGVAAPTDPPTIALAERVVSATTSSIEALCVEFTADDGHEDDVDLAILMHAARLWKRRQTPEGFQLFEGGAIRVGRLDPDVVEVLGRWLAWDGFG